MQYVVFTEEEHNTYPVVLLAQVLQKAEMEKEYLSPFSIPADDVIAFSIPKGTKKKQPKAEMQAWIKEELIPQLLAVEAQYIVVSDAEYFKVLTGSAKADAVIGYVIPCLYGDWQVVYVPSCRSVFYDPDNVRAKIARGIKALLDHSSGTYAPPGTDIIEFAAYPKTLADIKANLDNLLELGSPLTVDIEAFSLRPTDAGIGTISFAWNQGEGIAFAVDYEEIPGATVAPFGRNRHNAEVRKLLKEFFIKSKQKHIYHNISFDVSVLIYQLFMDDITDTEGLLSGLTVMLNNWDDTKLIAYLATNTCAGNSLSLKEQAQEFAGNYAEAEIKDITKIKLSNLLQYNLVDALSTWHALHKNWDKMVADEQLPVYTDLFKPAIYDIIQMQLTGLPLNMQRVHEVEGILQLDQTNALNQVFNTTAVQEFTLLLNEQWVITKNAVLKKKRVTLADADQTFNPNSGPQLQKLLYDFLGLPILGYTDTKLPSTDIATLKALRNHTDNADILALLNGLLDYTAVNKILTSFIPAMKNAPRGKDGWHYLCGFFNLGGTVSGRLSSSNPNLQNQPATKSKYAKLFKSCFQAPIGWLFCGLDFASLEDRISALTTKDPNKLKVYAGHTIYEVTIDGVCHHIRDDATVNFDGKTYTGEEFYETFGTF